LKHEINQDLFKLWCK